MGAFSHDELQLFIANYAPTDERLICFDWNGQHGDRFTDRNYEFRKEVLSEVLTDIRVASLELVRDLYRAETRFSKEAWCIDMRVSQLAEHLLRLGNDRFIEDYVEGKYQSFDSSMAAAAFRVEKSLAEHLLAVVRDRLQSEQDERRRNLLKSGEETFERWVKVMQGR
jgi:hypothetical protein